MCGITGATGRDAEKLVRAMNDALVHRGPDDEGVYCDKAAGVAIGARRLSIIDVEGGHQPLSNEDGTVWAVLNGEIYNHPALRNHLRTAGHLFRTGTDTEVVVHAYEEWGEAFVHALEGMFAIIVWDSRKRMLVAARDRFGEKPLFYAAQNGGLALASEITALVRAGVGGTEINAAAVDDLFVLGYVRNPASILDGVLQLPPAHLLTWHLGGDVELRRYWRMPPMTRGDSGVTMGEVVSEAARLLRASVRSRMISDVPLGILLSGGLDSSLIAVYAAEASPGALKTFTVDYDVGHVGEGAVAEATARAVGADHHHVLLAASDIAARVPRVLGALDQPIADQALVATHAVCQVARGEVVVAVGGEGADEVFGGYPRYRWMARAAQLQRRIPSRALEAATSVLTAPGAGAAAGRLARLTARESLSDRHLQWVAAGRNRARSGVYGPRLHALDHRALVPELDESDSRDLAARLMALDQETWLPDDVLAKADRASMLVSLELRTPYLQRELVELAAMLPPAAHNAGGGKAVLRQLLREAPVDVRPRRKHAFQVPAAEWLRGALRPTVDRQLRSGSAFTEGWFDREAVGALYSEHVDGIRDHSATLWPVLAFGVWLDTFRGTSHGG
jgi:asparagine synthase (glutamine-hydrolysing)